MIVENKEVQLEQLEEKMARKVLIAEGSMMMVEVHFEKGGVGEVHSHEEHEQVSYIKKGSFEVEVDGENKILQAGDSFYADKNVAHGVKALEDAVILDIFTPIRSEFL